MTDDGGSRSARGDLDDVVVSPPALHTAPLGPAVAPRSPAAPDTAGATEAAQTPGALLELLDDLDPSRLRDRIGGFAEQCREAWVIAAEWSLPRSFRRPRRVVVLGMGGSAIGADLIASLASRRADVPVQVVRGRSAPVVDADTLVVACSFSGETEEVLAAFEEATRGPGMALAITQGGPLAAMARSRSAAVLTYHCGGEPRSALGYGAMLLAGVLHRLGVFPLRSASELDDALDELDAFGRTLRPEAPQRTNVAKAVAGRLHGHLPVFVGNGYLQVAALRWQNQVNENAKQWAFHAALPEVMHNLVEGVGTPAPGGLRAVVLDAQGAGPVPADRVRVDLLVDHLMQAGVPAERLPIAGSSDLGILLQACHLGDWVSYYLALLNGVDPAPVPAITHLKEAQHRHTAEPRSA